MHTRKRVRTHTTRKARASAHMGAVCGLRAQASTHTHARSRTHKREQARKYAWRARAHTMHVRTRIRAHARTHAYTRTTHHAQARNCAARARTHTMHACTHAPARARARARTHTHTHTRRHAHTLTPGVPRPDALHLRRGRLKSISKLNRPKSISKSNHAMVYRYTKARRPTPPPWTSTPPP